MNYDLQKIVNDRRYMINEEYCGQSEAKLVVRFAGEWLGQYDTQKDAVMTCIIHQATRLGII